MGRANGRPWAMSIASPSAFAWFASMRTISENSPLCISAKQEAEPTNPHPIMATFLGLTLLMENPSFCGDNNADRIVKGLTILVVSFYHTTRPEKRCFAVSDGFCNKKPAPFGTGFLCMVYSSTTTAASGAFLRMDSMPFLQPDLEVYPSPVAMISPFLAFRRKRNSPALSV